MATFHAPGIYTKIISSGNKPIASVGSSTASFIGQSNKGPENDSTLITSWPQFVKLFGGFEESTYLAHAVYGFFLNGGSMCYVCNVGAPVEGQSSEDVAALIKGVDEGPAKRTGLNVFNALEDISLVAAPGLTSPIIHQILCDHASGLDDRMAILDGQDELDGVSLNEFPRPGDAANSAMYWPWIEVFDEATRSTKFVPPSGHVMGTIARTDFERGVHKAPANEVLRGALSLRYKLTRTEQGLFNPRGINIIRDLDDQGIRIYGARTLSTDPEWKYLNVRRLFQVVKQSITKGTDWVVFEPNDSKTWSRLRTNVMNYLKGVYKSGALVGQTPEDAFFVICDETNNPKESVDLGILNVKIGIAPVKPAEFINIEIQQKVDEE